MHRPHEVSEEWSLMYRRDALLESLKGLHEETVCLVQGRKDAEVDRDAALKEVLSMRGERDAAVAERDAALSRFSSAEKRIEELEGEAEGLCEVAEEERVGKVAAEEERDAASKEVSCMRGERDAARKERDAALRERDALLCKVSHKDAPCREISVKSPNNAGRAMSSPSDRVLMRQSASTPSQSSPEGFKCDGIDGKENRVGDNLIGGGAVSATKTSKNNDNISSNRNERPLSDFGIERKERKARAEIEAETRTFAGLGAEVGEGVDIWREMTRLREEVELLRGAVREGDVERAGLLHKLSEVNRDVANPFSTPSEGLSAATSSTGSPRSDQTATAQPSLCCVDHGDAGDTGPHSGTPPREEGCGPKIVHMLQGCSAQTSVTVVGSRGTPIWVLASSSRISAPSLCSFAQGTTLPLVHFWPCSDFCCLFAVYLFGICCMHACRFFQWRIGYYHKFTPFQSTPPPLPGFWP